MAEGKQMRDGILAGDAVRFLPLDILVGWNDLF